MIPDVRACSTLSVRGPRAATFPCQGESTQVRHADLGKVVERGPLTTASSGISRERRSPGGAWQNLNLAPGMWTIPTLLNRPVRLAQGRRTEGIKRLRVGQGLIYATM
jgi:hypothetical protein